MKLSDILRGGTSKQPAGAAPVAPAAPMAGASPTPRDDIPYNPQAAAEIQRGAMKSGYQPDEWKKNLRRAFGMTTGE
jgi:hypothetical protein